jgi:hypothetical protein
VLLLARGNWQDTVWEPVVGLKEISPESIRIARRDVLHPGDVQVLEPTEPHGWEAGEVRNVDDGLLLVWTGDDRGKPRSEIDITTGTVTDHWRSA